MFLWIERVKDMPATTFDTLKFVKALKAAGFDDAQAEVLSEALKEAQDIRLADLATKADLRALELKMEGELKVLKWMVGAILAGIVSLLLKAFFMR
jgi:hypothetical protein